MTRKEFIKKRKVLFWYIKNPENISDEVLVEFILNYGNWDDVMKLFKILGIKKTASIFRKQIKGPRMNYDRKVAHYFKLYFQRHA
jgi:hypothetical protein